MSKIDSIQSTSDALPSYIPELRSFIASKTRDVNKVDDVAQETLARTYKSANISQLKNPLAYLISVAKTVLYDQWNSSREIECGVDLDGLINVSSTVEQQHMDSERIRAVSRALNKMPPMRRRVFEMRRIQGMPRASIAEELGLSVESVKKHINRAMVDITMYMEVQGW